MKRYTELIKENGNNLSEHDGILVIVDVQRVFDKFIPDDFEKKIANYCEDFDKVYQIWDSNKVGHHSFNFPKQVKLVRKNYGTKFSDQIVKISKSLEERYPNVKEGDKFKIGKNQYLVKVDNNHKWFYVNPDIYELYRELQGKKIILIGGADFECLEDIHISMQSFGINSMYNHDYIYSAKTSNKQQATINK
jgi:hypothetical protein